MALFGGFPNRKEERLPPAAKRRANVGPRVGFRNIDKKPLFEMKKSDEPQAILYKQSPAKSIAEVSSGSIVNVNRGRCCC